MLDRILDKATIPLILVMVLLVSININWNKEDWKGIIEADGKGYYAYLPAVFIYQDLNFGFFSEIDEDKYYHKNRFYDYKVLHNGKLANKYFVGTAIAMMPFFLIGHLVTLMSDQPVDGYSKWYMIFLNIGAVFYLGLACVYLKRILGLYQINMRNASLVLIAMVFATNVFYYTVGEPSMSHIYSFAFVTLFIYYAKKYFSDYTLNTTLILAFLFGLIVLIRPVNSILIMLLPFIAGGADEFKKGALKFIGSPKYLIGGILISIAILFIQPMIYQIQVGSFFIDSYEGEGFNFLDPAMIDILFSYKKGLFVYTPLIFISLLGFGALYQRSKFEFYSLLFFLGFLTYILSSWWCWWYGGSFSSRAYLEYFSLFAILLGLALEHITHKSIKRVYALLMMLFIIVCQIQTYQYRYYYIHWSEMNKVKYWDVFLRVDLLTKPKD